MSDQDLGRSVQRVQDALNALGMDSQVVYLPSGARTAPQAAQSVGCTVAQIVKSLIFRTVETDRPVLVLTSGANMVDEQKISRLLGEGVRKADAAFVREHTGFAIGGVPPVGHLQPLELFVDGDLMQFEEIWAAAGTPHTVFRLTPADLAKIAPGRITSVRQDS